MNEIKSASLLPILVLVRLYSLEYLHTADNFPTCLDFYDQNPKPGVFGAPKIDSNSVIPVDAPPLTFIVDLNELSYMFCNNGETATLTPTGNTSINLTGGLFCGQTFKFWKAHFIWAPNNRQSSVWTVNGIGFPLCVSFYYYNSQYSDPSEAADYSNGIASVERQIIVGGHITNEKFAKFYEYSQQILCYNTCVEVKNAFLISEWWLPIPNRNLSGVPDYVFTTTMYEQEIGKNITVTTFAISYSLGPWISDDDFKRSFLSFRNKNGETYSNNYIPTVDSKDIKVYEIARLFKITD